MPPRCTELCLVSRIRSTPRYSYLLHGLIIHVGKTTDRECPSSVFWKPAPSHALVLANRCRPSSHDMALCFRPTASQRRNERAGRRVETPRRKRLLTRVVYICLIRVYFRPGSHVVRGERMGFLDTIFVSNVAFSGRFSTVSVLSRRRRVVLGYRSCGS